MIKFQGDQSNTEMIILAGGFGTRLAKVYPDLPKPLVPIGDTCPLALLLDMAVRANLDTVSLTLHHKAEQIIEFLERYRESFAAIRYVVEATPLGSAGALNMLELCDKKRYVVCLGDLGADIDLSSLIDFHNKKSADLTVVSHPNDHPADSDLVLENEGRIRGILSKNLPRKSLYSNNVMAGIYMVNGECLKSLLTAGEQLDFSQDIVGRAIEANRTVMSYKTPEYIKDMGTPERLLKVESDYFSGKLRARNKSFKQCAVFFDRDGTLNELKGYISDHSQLELTKGAGKAVKRVNKTKFLSVLVTNQPVVARGEASLADLKSIHNQLEMLLSEESAFLDEIYYCPHHRDRGYDGEVTQFKIDCDCRKPKAGMFLEAARDLNINLSKSFMIGDSDIDVSSAHSIGCQTFFLAKDFQLQNFDGPRPDYVCREVSEATDFICGDVSTAWLEDLQGTLASSERALVTACCSVAMHNCITLIVNSNQPLCVAFLSELSIEVTSRPQNLSQIFSPWREQLITGPKCRGDQCNLFSASVKFK